VTARHVALVLAGVAAGVALTGGAVVLSRHGGGGTDQPPAAAAAKPTALSPQGLELVDLLKKGLDATYHARYQSAVADPRAQGTQMTMDVWRKGQLSRQEVAVQAKSTRTRSDTFQLPPRSVECTQAGDGPWACKPPSYATPGAAPEVKIEEALGRGAIDVRDETIGGLPTRCFTFPAGGDLSETCLMNDGVVARIVTPSSRFDLVALSGVVSDDDFTVPVAIP
jgi:hypothetical protein